MSVSPQFGWCERVPTKVVGKIVAEFVKVPGVAHRTRRSLTTSSTHLFLMIAWGWLQLAVQAETTEIRVSELEAPLQVWLPSGHEKSSAWPVIFHYHGTNGSSATRPMRRLAGENDFVIVGMTYLQKGRFPFTEANIQAEIDVLKKVIREHAAHLRMDRKRAYVSGFSKGGWISGMMIERAKWLAGGLILGAGLYDKQRSSTEPFASPPWVFVGVGETDGNHVMSRVAAEKLRRRKAHVTLGIWPDTGHAYPTTISANLQQWFEAAKQGVPPNASLKLRARSWLLRELKKADEIQEKDAFPLYLTLQSVAAAPFLQILPKAERRKVEEALTQLRQFSSVKAEWEVEQALEKVIRREMRNRYVENLKACQAAYARIYGQHPQRHFASLPTNTPNAPPRCCHEPEAKAIPHSLTSKKSRNTRLKTPRLKSGTESISNFLGAIHLASRNSGCAVSIWISDLLPVN